MKLTYSALFDPIEFPENVSQVLVIENQKMLRQVLLQFIEKYEHDTGDVILSSDNEEIQFSKYVELIMNPLILNFETRALVKKIESSLAEEYEDNELVAQMINTMHALQSKLLTDLAYPAYVNQNFGVSDIIHLAGIHIDTGDKPLPEALLNYCEVQNHYLGKGLFIFFNLFELMSKDEMNALIQELYYRKLLTLFIEGTQPSYTINGEEITIVDNDLCVIK